VLTSKNLVPFH